MVRLFTAPDVLHLLQVRDGTIADLRARLSAVEAMLMREVPR